MFTDGLYRARHCAMHCKWLLLPSRPRGREKQSDWQEEEKQRDRSGDPPILKDLVLHRGLDPGHSS